MHREVGHHAAVCGIEEVICVGALSKEMAEEAEQTAARTGSGTKVIYEEDREGLLERIAGYIHAGDTILVKASHGMGFDRVVEALQDL